MAKDIKKTTPLSGLTNSSFKLYLIVTAVFIILSLLMAPVALHESWIFILLLTIFTFLGLQNAKTSGFSIYRVIIVVLGLVGLAWSFFGFIDCGFLPTLPTNEAAVCVQTKSIFIFMYGVYALLSFLAVEGEGTE